jgi:hypothetical protein
MKGIDPLYQNANLLYKIIMLITMKKISKFVIYMCVCVCVFICKVK